MEKNSLLFQEKKKFTRDGQDYVLYAYVRLDDKCKNGICSISVTGEMYIKNKFGRFEDYMFGALGDEIEHAKMKASKFVHMHGKTIYGYDFGFIENMIYDIKRGNKECVMKDAMLFEDEYSKLLLSINEKEYFKYLLFELGIMDRLENEANKAIKMLEELTGDTWINPYDPKKDKHKIILTADERAFIEDRIKEGYYTESAILSREKERKDNKIKIQRNCILDEFNTKLKSLETKRDINLAILDCGIICNNYIYYNHSNKLEFNWKDYGDFVSEEEYNTFLNNVDKSKLPENIEIVYNKRQ